MDYFNFFNSTVMQYTVQVRILNNYCKLFAVYIPSYRKESLLLNKMLTHPLIW